MPSKLALHHNTAQDLTRLERFYRNTRPAVALHLDLGNTDLPNMIREVSPNTIIVFRKWFSSQSLNGPEGKADDAVGRLMDSACGRAGLIKHAVLYNEIGPHPTHDYMKFELRGIERLAQYNVGYGEGSWSVGTPDVPDWTSTWFTDPVRRSAFMSLHEYCAPTMWDPRGMDGANEGWFTLRYKKMLRAMHNSGIQTPPIIFTECGIDSGAAHWDPGVLGGWRSFTSPQGYLEQLAWYDAHIQASVEVLGACIFCIHDISGDWESFDVKGEMLDRLEDYMVSQLDDTDVPEPLPDWIDDLRGKLRVHDTKPYDTRELRDINRIIIHHSAVSPSIGPYQFANYHVGARDYPGIAYHFCIGADGHTYMTNSLETISWHSRDNNNNSVGICLQGNFMDGAQPTDAQLAATRRLIDHIEWTLGYTDEAIQLIGHQEVVDTACPGSTWNDWRWKLTPEPVEPPDEEWKQRALVAEDKLDRIEDIVEE